MENGNTIIEFLLFKEISNRMNEVDYEEEEEIHFIEEKIHQYTQKYGEKGLCLANKLNMMQKNN